MEVAVDFLIDAVFHIGGLVVEDALQRQEDGLAVRFDVTDNAAVVPVSYPLSCQTCSV